MAETCDSQTWRVKADKFASESYRYTALFTVTFTGKSGNIYLPSLL